MKQGSVGEPTQLRSRKAAVQITHSPRNDPFDMDVINLVRLRFIGSGTAANNLEINVVFFFEPQVRSMGAQARARIFGQVFT